MTDYPQGDGHPGCPDCKGRGVVEVTEPGYPIPVTQACKCVRFRDLQRNMERGWKGLSSAKYRRRSSTPLVKYTQDKLWIRTSEEILRKHMWRLVAGHHPRWAFSVYSDADLMDAWLSRMDVDDIYDADVERIRRTAVSGRFVALVDLVEPPELLVLRLGVKAARNSAMPEVLLEALQHRSMVDRPTWVVDTPGYPLEQGHISFDHRVGEYLHEWEFVELHDDDDELPETPSETPQKGKRGKKGKSKKSKTPGRMTLAGTLGSSAE